MVDYQYAWSIIYRDIWPLTFIGLSMVFLVFYYFFVVRPREKKETNEVYRITRKDMRTYMFWYTLIAVVGTIWVYPVLISLSNKPFDLIAGPLLVVIIVGGEILYKATRPFFLKRRINVPDSCAN